MTIKITKPGKTPSDLHKGVCHRCGCEFTCQTGDITHEWDGRDQRSYPYVVCPTVSCNERVYVSKVKA